MKCYLESQIFVQDSKDSESRMLFYFVADPSACTALVSHGQMLFLCRGVIACSISAPRKKGLVWLTGLTGTKTTIIVVVVN